MKKVIFIGGTSRSGSTLLDLILANDARAMSLGEIDALFYPTRKHHFEEIERLKKCEKWIEILRGKKGNLYPNLIKFFPEVDIFLDSSKNPFWYDFHQQNIRGNYTIKNILIYKSPSEMAQSYIKRGFESEWVRTYISYHKKYFSLINNFVSISYKDLILNEKYIKELCRYLELKYFKNKMDYWDKSQITFFGSNTVKLENSQDAINQISEQSRKTLTYDEVKIEYLERIENTIKNNPELLKIEHAISQKGLFCNIGEKDINKTGYNAIYLNLIFVKMKLQNLYYYFFPKDIFKKK